MKDAENNRPKFTNVFCSQCGQEFGPGEHGFSHCANHSTKNIDLREVEYESWRKARIEEFKQEYLMKEDFVDAMTTFRDGNLKARKLYRAITSGDLESAKEIATLIMDEAASYNAECKILTEEEMMEVKLGLH